MSSTSNAARPHTYDPGTAKFLRTTTTAVGLVFLPVGILGFIPGITTNYDDLTFAGHMSDAKLLGVFQVSGPTR